MRGLINHGSRSKHKFLLKALPLPLPWLAHLCSLTHTLPPLSHNLCSYYHPVTGSFDGYSSFLFSFSSGLGMRDPRPRIGIVICPLFPFWRAGHPVWKHSTGGSSIIFPLMARGPSGAAYFSAVSVPVMACGPSSERALCRGPSYDLPLFHSWRAARAGPLSICLSCFIAPALARGLSSERALRRRPSSHFPFCLILALPALCVSALHGRGVA